MPLAETLGAMTRLRESGKTRFIGVSNFTTTLLDEAARHADIVCDQVEYHPFLSQRAVLGAVRKHGMFLTAYSPVARGQVTSDPKLQAIGKKYGKSAAQVALRWLMQQDNVAAIPKAGSRAHMQANLDDFRFRADARGQRRDRRARRQRPHRRHRRLVAGLGSAKR